MSLSEKIKARGRELGFSGVGIVPAAMLEREARLLENWLRAGMHGEMTYMERNFDLRIDPEKLLPGTKTIVSVIANYFPDSLQAEQVGHGKISIYAQGQDYHTVLKTKLYDLFEFICKQVGEVNGRAFVDSAPMLDKAWAERAGLGWIGKHSNLINRQIGSYFFIGNLLLDCMLDYDTPAITNYCGTCTACIDSCPTQAIVAPYQVDARKCISYLNIELRRDLTAEEESALGEWLFGCDICQHVCPWNRFAKPTAIDELKPKPEVKRLTEADILDMTSSVFKRLFSDSVVLRTGLKRMKRNAAAVKANLEKKKLR
ncbi:MAG: tRNA epoxyqueuosine(34) reductase QueG [Chlorobiales bacterium]|nr:tRNA epoxyqueuosine(34) reductase QueG [Chlorobiales bacterium]